MTQGFRRPLRWLACAALAAAALSQSAPAIAGPPAVAPSIASSVDPAPVADVPNGVFEELAGSAAGAGRERPGRPVTEPANPETVLASRPIPRRPRTEPALPVPADPSAPSVVGALGTEPNERAADLAAHLLPLGTGFALMGLGFGFMGMRLRRGR